MYIECPHCSAIFTLPTGLDQPKVRCGECGTIFDSKQAESELVPEEDDTGFSDTTSLDTQPHEEIDDALDLTSSELDAIENIDISISNELDAELDKFTSNEPSVDELESEAALDDDFLFESRTLKKLSDTLELPALDDLDYSDHSDSLRRNELAQTLDETDSEEALTDDIFEEFISSNQIVGNITPSEGITSKNTGTNIADDESLLPELDENIEAVESTPTLDKLAETSEDIRILESAPNTVFSDLGSEIEKDFNMTDEIEVPDLDQLPTLQNDVEQIVDQLPYTATNDDVVNDVPFPPDEPSFTQQQMLLEPQDELPGLDEPATDESQEFNLEDQLVADSQETPADTLISLQNAEFDEPTLQTRFSKREYLYDNRALLSSLVVVLCLTLLLSAQYLRHNRDHFKHYVFTRPLANAVCSVSGCDIVPPREPEKITILESSTYPHNSIENALTIKAKVVNQSGNDQPFPVLQVNFLNLAGARIATRRFGPQEYLNKLPRRNGLMPPDEPVFFEINVADPSRDGVSFDLQIR